VIERFVSKLVLAIIFVLVLVDAVDTWWNEERHHRHCARSARG
jgi:hypothetical protein